MLASIPSAVLHGVDGLAVAVEVHVSNGLPGFTIVGLPDASCREARDRVRAALLSSGLEWPLRRITVNLAPSGLPKAGSGLDVAMAIGVLVATGALTAAMVADKGFLGEVGLDGSLRSTAGTLPLVDAIGVGTIVVPRSGASQAAVLGRHQVRVASSLKVLVAALRGTAPWEDLPPLVTDLAEPAGPDLADVRGQTLARRAVEVAAAGGHHLLLSGPPGAGKTMLAQRLVGLLPDLRPAAALEATKVHSAAGERLPPQGLLVRPPFRAPHHGASMVALVGGGSAYLRPGEISLANGGVLFLDELAEFSPAALDALRQPLEDGRVRIARARSAVTFPARFLLVAATNPCPCGNAGSAELACRCPEVARRRYWRRLSGPLLDRFDLRLAVQRPDPVELTSRCRITESSAAVSARVAEARRIAHTRGIDANRDLQGHQLDRFAALDHDGAMLLRGALRRGALTARGADRVRRVARTLADLSGEASCQLSEEHLAVAMHLRGAVGVLSGSDAA